jgi:glycosyltransferase involved in cell wall biosynthesis
LTLSEFPLFRRQDTCGGPTITLLLVANLIERKGAVYLIQAVDLLRKRTDIDFRCAIIGWGPLEEDLRRQTRESGLEDIIDIAGHLDAGAEMTRRYREADIFVLTSFMGEGFPRVLYEAMSQSLPIVATDVCGIGNKLKDGVHLRLIRPQSAEAIAQGVLELVRNPDLRRTFIRNGYDFMEKMVNGPKADEQVMQLLHKHAPDLLPIS